MQHRKTHSNLETTRSQPNKFFKCNLSLAISLNSLDQAMIDELAFMITMNPIILNVMYAMCVVLNEQPNVKKVSMLLR